MSRFCTYLLLAIAVPMLMAADYSEPKLINRETSDLQLVHNENYDAEFTGSIWVSGVITAQEHHIVDNDYEPELVLVPDDESMKRLPYFSGYEIKGITIKNYAEAVSMIFGKAAAKHMMKQVHDQKMEGRFLIEGYEVGIECDYPWASAKLVSAKVPPKVAVVGNDVDAHCG